MFIHIWLLFRISHTCSFIMNNSWIHSQHSQAAIKICCNLQLLPKQRLLLYLLLLMQKTATSSWYFCLTSNNLIGCPNCWCWFGSSRRFDGYSAYSSGYKWQVKSWYMMAKYFMGYEWFWTKLYSHCLHTLHRTINMGSHICTWNRYWAKAYN